MAEADRLTRKEFYEEARKQYFRIKTEFPQSPLQVEADRKIADTYYNEESYTAAATAYEDFIKTYPGRLEIPDVLYKLGLSYAKQMPRTSQRDTRATSKAVDVFTRLMVDYPNNKYMTEAQEWIEKARHQLAEKIFEIGRFYERKGQYDSAARRFAEVADQYADSPLVEESLSREIQDLKRSGQKEKAEEMAAKFLEKYPHSKFASKIRK